MDLHKAHANHSVTLEELQLQLQVVEQSVRGMGDSIKKITAELQEHSEQLKTHNDKLDNLHAANANLSMNYGKIQTEVDEMDKTLNALETNMGQISSRYSGQSATLSQVQRKIVDLGQLQNRIQSQLNALKGKMH